MKTRRNFKPKQLPTRIPKTPRSRATSLYVYPKTLRYPIGDLYHARQALVFLLSPTNASSRKTVAKAVQKAYPTYDWGAWWNSKRKGKKGVPTWNTLVGTKKNPRRRKNQSKGPVIELNKTTIKALENYFSGNPEYSTMAYLAENAKKKSPSSIVFIFAPTPTFVELLRSELQRVLAYAKFKTDRDFNALKKLLKQTYNVRFNPKKTTYKQAMESIKKHLKAKGWSISGDYGQKGRFVLLFKKQGVHIGLKHRTKTSSLKNVRSLHLSDIRSLSMKELDSTIAYYQQLFDRPSF